MITICPSSAIQAWKKLQHDSDMSIYFTTIDSPDTALSDDPNNTLGTEEAESAAEDYTTKFVCDLIGVHTSAGAIFGSDSEKILLLFSRQLGLIEVTLLTVTKLPLKDYVHKGIPKSYRSMDLNAFVIDPTIKDLTTAIGDRVKVAVGEFASEFTKYIGD